MTKTSTNAFASIWALGYERLVPIVPPTAEISDKSSLSKRLNTSQDPRGKAVGIRGQDGKWFGFDWLKYEPDERDVERWAGMGAGVGIKTGNGLVAIDADTLDTERARIIRDEVAAVLPLSSVRIGQYPKAAYIVLTDPDFRYTRIEFGERDDKGRLLDRVEILADGRQFVAHGIHPKTKKPYEWPKGIPARQDLPYISSDDLLALLNRLRAKLPAASEIIKEGATTEVNPAALRGELNAVRKAVRATPNTSELFPSRESYRDYGYAIKAALPDNAQEAYDLFAEWCMRWDGGTNDPDIIEADWRRMKPPFRRGAGWLYELAEQHGAGNFTLAEVWFDTIPDEAENPFAEIREQPQDTYELLRIGDIVNRPPPKYLIERHIVEKAVGFVYSEPGVGKTFLTLDMALSLATGLPDWQGDAINIQEGNAVLYIASEGSYGFRNRIKAWFKHKSIGEHEARNFFMIEQTINFMSGEDIQRLIRTVKRVADVSLSLVVVDTVSRAMPGADENLQKDMTLFVKACDTVRDTFGCAVIGVHHAGKSGDMRGSTVLLGAGDFVFRLARKKGATIGLLHCEKQKDAPDGWEEPYRFETVSLGEGETSLIIERADAAIGPTVTLTPDVSAAVLEAMRKAWDEGEPWSKAPQSKGRYAIRNMVNLFGFDAEKAEETLSMWEQTGLIAVELLSAKHRITGFKVVADHGQHVQIDDIFG